MTDAEIEEVLEILPDLTKWANEITAYATEAAVNHGKEWRGFKVVEGRSVRKYVMSSWQQKQQRNMATQTFIVSI